MIDANRHQIRTRGGRRGEGLREERLGLSVELVDWDGAFAKLLIEDRPSIDVVHEVRPVVDEEGRDDRPCHDQDRAERDDVSVFHGDSHLAFMTGGAVYSQSRVAQPGR